MALQVWLPCTDGTLKNLGIYNTTISSTSFASNNNGKLGKCIKCNTTSMIDTQIPSSVWDFTTKSISFGAWIKINQTELAQVTSTSTYSGNYTTAGGTVLGRQAYGGLGLRWRTNNLTENTTPTNIYLYVYIRNTSSGTKLTSWLDFPFNTWVHIFVIFNREALTMSIYKDGLLYDSITISMSTYATTGNISLGTFLINLNSWDGGNGLSKCAPWYMNDIRIYDYALSPKEVKEISQGLVLHYKLDSSTFNINPNNYPLVPDGVELYDYILSSGTLWINTEIPYNSTNNNYKVHFKFSMYGNKSSYDAVYGAYKGEGYKALRFIRGNNNTSFLAYYNVKAGGGGTSVSSTLNNTYEVIQTKDYTLVKDLTNNISNIYNHKSATGSNTSGVNIFLFALGSSSIPSKIKMHYWEIYDGNTLLGNFIPCTYLGEAGMWNSVKNKFYGNEGTNTFTLGSKLSLSNLTVYDSSGYLNNGNITGNLTINSNSPRYNYFVSFPTDNDYIELENNFLDLTQPFTISCWCNLNGNANQMPITIRDANHSRAFNFGSNAWAVNQTLIFTPSNYSGVQKGSIKTGWCHYAMLFNGSTLNLYRDGVLLYTQHRNNISYTSNITSNLIELNKAPLSDFRIYVTALSDEDIKELYDTSAIIDNLNNLHTKELIEDNMNYVEISKKGIVKTDSLTEGNNGVIFSSDNVECNQLIEI